MTKKTKAEPSRPVDVEFDKGANIYQRILWVRARVPRVEKSTQVKGGGGSYMAITHDDVTEALRKLMAAAGVFHLLRILDEEIIDLNQRTKGGSAVFSLRAKAEILYINAADPSDSFTQPLSAWVNDFGDKAPAKLQSYAMKVGLMKMFMLNTGEVDEEATFDERSTYNAVVGEDEDESDEILNAAKRYFGDEAGGVLKSLATLRFKIEDGDWRLIPSYRLADALKSLKEKHEDDLVDEAGES